MRHSIDSPGTGLEATTKLRRMALPAILAAATPLTMQGCPSDDGGMETAAQTTSPGSTGTETGDGDGDPATGDGDGDRGEITGSIQWPTCSSAEVVLAYSDTIGNSNFVNTGIDLKDEPNTGVYMPVPGYVGYFFQDYRASVDGVVGIGAGLSAVICYDEDPNDGEIDTQSDSGLVVQLQHLSKAYRYPTGENGEGAIPYLPGTPGHIYNNGFEGTLPNDIQLPCEQLIEEEGLVWQPQGKELGEVGYSGLQGNGLLEAQPTVTIEEVNANTIGESWTPEGSTPRVYMSTRGDRVWNQQQQVWEQGPAFDPTGRNSTAADYANDLDVCDNNPGWQIRCEETDEGSKPTFSEECPNP